MTVNLCTMAILCLQYLDIEVSILMDATNTQLVLNGFD